MKDTFDFIRPLLDGRMLRVVSDTSSHYIYIMYSMFNNPEKWSALTTCADYSKYWLGYEDQTIKNKEKVRMYNSLLVKVRQSFYMFVGQNVYTYRDEDEVKSFVAYEGGGKIPFAIAFGSENILFLTEKMKCSYEELLRYYKETAGKKEIDTKEKIMEMDAGELYRDLYKMINTGDFFVHMLNVMSSMI